MTFLGRIEEWYENCLEFCYHITMGVLVPIMVFGGILIILIIIFWQGGKSLLRAI